MFINLDGEIIPLDKAFISPINRGMMYGDGCFETIRSYTGKMLEWDAHFERLSGGIQYLEMKNSLNNKQLKKKTDELLEKNNLLGKDAVIRIQCWRDGGRGYPETDGKLHWMVQASELKVRNKFLHLVLAKTRAIPEESLTRKFKLSNGLNFIKTAQEAKSNNADDALLLTVDNFISETTSANIFWIHDDTVFTPSEKCDLLPGITRNLLLNHLPKNGIKIEMGEFTIHHLKTADAVFCCNSIREIEVVKSLHETEFDTEYPFLQKTVEIYQNYKMSQLQE